MGALHIPIFNYIFMSLAKLVLYWILAGAKISHFILYKRAGEE